MTYLSGKPSDKDFAEKCRDSQYAWCTKCFHWARKYRIGEDDLICLNCGDHTQRKYINGEVVGE